MALKDGLRTLLLAQGGITALCPAQTASNGASIPAIFVGKVKQGMKTPFICISRIRHDPLKTLANTTGMAESEIDIDCFANTEPKAEAIAKAVSDFLKDYSGAAGGSDTIDAVWWDDTNEFENQEDAGPDVWRHAVTLTFTIHHT
jgi:hypothetical protein